MKIKEYVTVIGRVDTTLDTRVNSLIHDGWQPLGWPCHIEGQAWDLTQAMVKYEEEPDIHSPKFVKEIVDVEIFKLPIDVVHYTIKMMIKDGWETVYYKEENFYATLKMVKYKTKKLVNPIVGKPASLTK